MNAYEKQATNFFKNNNLTITITQMGNKPADWTPHGKHYSITLKGKDRRLSFSFWGSVNDAQRNIDPSPYDVLACLSSDVYLTDETEIENEFGRGTYSYKQLHKIAEHGRGLQAFFTPAEIEQLSEIR